MEQPLYPVMLSALQHHSYCPRQCALIHLEQSFDENIYTLRGRREHEKVDEGGASRRGTTRTERSLPLYNDTLGIYGIADVVEFELNEQGNILSAMPVEHKHGRRHKAIHDEIQLCAQALCLESMFGQEIKRGAIYHISSKKRRDVEFDTKLRQHTLHCIEETRALLLQRQLPPPTTDVKRCRHCSLKHSCMPSLLRSHGVNIRKASPSI